MLQNKIIVVTGGAGLLGKEFVKAILNSGGTAVIADINPELIKKIYNELIDIYNETTIDYCTMDITSANSIKNCIDYLHNKYGKIDALVNSAYPRNKNFGADVFDVKYEDFCENINMNLGGYFLTSQQFGEYFQTQKHGNIINLSSIYGVVAPRFEIYEGTNMTNAIEYAAIKGGLLHIVKYFAKYFKGMNIRVNAISPGGIFDNQPEPFLSNYKKQCLNKGMLNKSDINGTLIYLLSDMSKYVNGQNIIVDDGFCL